MQKFFFILLVAVSPMLSYSQTSFLKDAEAKLNKALILKDTSVLKQLLHKDVSYGHSNGWVETKNDVINDLVNGALAYKKIETKDVKWIVTNNVATLRNTSDIDYVKDGKAGQLHMHVVQVWLKTNKGWQLLARQSTKI